MMKDLLRSAVNLIPFPVRHRIRHIPGIKQLQQRLMARYMDGARFEHRIKGGPADGLVYPVVLPQDKQIWMGTYELAFAQNLAKAVERENVCYDVGGYRGFFSGVMARQGAGIVHCFEPMAANVDQIRSMVALNPAMRVTVHQLALADAPGTTTFAVMSEASMGKLAQSRFDSGDLPQSYVTVPVETIDHLIEHGRIVPADLIKFDVEGAEALVLQGARKLIANRKPVLYIEAHSRELARQCVEFLKPLGYRIRALETDREPDFLTEPEVCHLEARPAHARSQAAR